MKRNVVKKDKDMQQMEQEIKELQAGLGAVVQALNFLQTFLESDYGLKFQFHAYCNSPVYSSNSGLLDSLKEKYPESVQFQDAFFNDENDRSYQTHHSSSDAGSTTLIHIQYPNQDDLEEINQNVINSANSACTSSCPPSLDQNYAENSDNADGALISSQSRHHSMLSNADENLISASRSPLMVNEDELFGIGDLATMKDSHEFFQHDEAEMITFNKPEFDDENESSQDMLTGSPNVNEVTTRNPIIGGTVLRLPGRRGQKEKIFTGYKCPHCRRKCSDRIKLELHMTHHKQQFQCLECGIWLADKSVLNRHMRTHTGDRPFKCEFCKNSFSRQDIVKKHIQRKHKEMITKSNSQSQ